MSEMKPVTVKLVVELDVDESGETFKKAYYSASGIDVFNIEGTINSPADTYIEDIEKRVVELVRSFSTDEFSFNPEVIRMTRIATKKTHFNLVSILNYIKSDIIIFNKERDMCSIYPSEVNDKIIIVEVPEKYDRIVRVFLDGINFENSREV